MILLHPETIINIRDMKAKNHFSGRPLPILFVWVVMLWLSGWQTAVHAQTLRAYAALDSAGTLTFRYGEKDSIGACEYLLNDIYAPRWVNENGPDIKKVVFDPSFSQARPTSCIMWFDSCKNLTAIEGMENLNTEEVTDMSCMFSGCTSLTSLDLSHFDTRKVTNMSMMFSGCNSLDSLNLSGFNTQEVTYMNFMFADCPKLVSLDLSGFNTQHVTDMSSMFMNCSALASLDLSAFRTDSVTMMNSMFQNCSALDTLDLSMFHTANVTDMGSMFNGCDGLVRLVLTGFDTRKVTDMRYMFCKCQSLATLDLSGFDTQCVTDMNSMFKYCYNLQSLDLSSFDMQRVTDMNSMFFGCHSLASLDLSEAKAKQVTDMGKMFCNCSSLTSLDLSGFDTQQVTDMRHLFANCSALATILVSSKFTTTSVLYDAYMFHGCTSLRGAIAYDADKTRHEYANCQTGYFTRLFGKLGDEKITAVGEPLTAGDIVLSDDTDLTVYEPFAVNAVSYRRQTAAGRQWGSLCLPFDVPLDTTVFQAFTLLSATGDVMVLREMEEVIPAGTPVIIKQNDNLSELNLSATNREIKGLKEGSATQDNTFQLVGLYARKTFDKVADSDCYIVKGEKLMNVARILEGSQIQTVSSSPYRAYIQGQGQSAGLPRMLGIAIGGETTAIDSLNAADTVPVGYYDLQGHRITSLQKGINLMKRGSQVMKIIIK